jgi:hypothetical protein
MRDYASQSNITTRSKKTLECTRNESTSIPEYKISFIQVTRHHCHLDLEALCKSEYLKWLFKASCAVYLPTNFPVFDILASIRCCYQTIEKYIPLAVSVKARRAFGSSDIRNEIECMRDQMTDKGISPALCLLIVLDAKDAANLATTDLLKKDDLQYLATTVVSKALVIGPKDAFGVSNLVEMTRFGGSLLSEIYSSHSIVRQATELKPRYRATENELFKGLKRNWVPKKGQQTTNTTNKEGKTKGKGEEEHI